MPRTRIALAVFFYTTFALAQPFKVEPDAATAEAGTSEAGAPASAVSADAAVPAPIWPRAPEPSATTSSSSGPRPDPGPGLRGREGRTRTVNPASGVLLVIIIVAAMGWYVVKRMRRY